MRRAVVALLAAVVIVGATTAAFLVFEPALGPAFAFWPGFLAQWLLRRAGITMTNRVLLWVTVTWWWFAVWLTLTAVSRATAGRGKGAPSPRASA